MGTAQLDETLDLGSRVGPRIAAANNHIAQSLPHPSLDIVANAAAGFKGRGHPHGHVKGPPSLLGNPVGLRPHGPHEIGQNVAQAVRVVGWQMKGVPLPIQFNAVPVGQAAGLNDALQEVGSHFGDRHIPRSRSPARCLLLAQKPLGVLLPQRRQLSPLQATQIPRAQIPEVIVVHAQRWQHRHAQFAPALH